jgi:hypothetical protein
MPSLHSRSCRSCTRPCSLLPFLLASIVGRHSLIPPAAQAWTLPSSLSNEEAITRRLALQRGGIHTAAVLLLESGPTLPAFAANPSSDIESRLIETSILKQQPVSAVSSGSDMTVYPDFMEGRWQVTQTLVSVETPLCLKYAGGPNGIESIAEKSIAESRSRLNQPVSLQLRFVRVGGDGTAVVVEDRIFNTRQRLDSFAGKSVVAAVDYADTRASNRASMKALTGRDDDPLTTVTTRFKGPAAQKTFVTAHHDVAEVARYNNNAAQQSSSCPTITAPWTGFESQRSLFALTNASTAPPITTDSELIFQFLPDCFIDQQQQNYDHITGRLRIAGYLNPNDKLYFEARNRAVTLQDYTLDLKRIVVPAESE